MGDPPVSWRALLVRVEGQLAALDDGSSGPEARWMVEEASGYRGAELFDHLAEPASRLAEQRLASMVARRLTGEPLQYVLGSWSFRHLDLFVDRRVLIPRPETEVVVDHALAVLDARRAAAGAATLVAADLGTGSGAIGLSLAFERPWVEVIATDASVDALEVARSNLAGIGRPATRVRLATGSWFDALPGEVRGALSLVVSNPPYVASSEALPREVADWEPARALVAGARGTEALETLVAGALDWLTTDGALVLELAPGQADDLRRRALDHGYRQATVHRDHAGRDRVLVAER